MVCGEAEMNAPLVMGGNELFVSRVSPLQALYYTKENLPADDALHLGEAVSASVSEFSQTVRGGIDETFRERPLNDPDKHDDQPKFFPEEQPEIEPIYQ